MIVTDPSGTDLEVRHGTPAAVIADALGIDPLWCGDIRLDPLHRAGHAPLLHGARLSSGPGEAQCTPVGAWLEVVRGPDAGACLTVPSNGILVGRDSACDLVVDDPAVSARHARVWLRARRAVTDAGSTNGPGTWRRRFRSDHTLTLGRTEAQMA
ncbi:FHA domain-containing protein [Demequina litorisediminis]|uniref:FHA domain-containing protein n=1 Tax=Demequina litorisediminis TaxID=1849022 RepID=A0ABQ6IID9_9MICO|nr:FHA domain-containing protein [Demequina litorisediminis]GMA36479.1 hypothetical protein GCM10025876_26830 [Demequina litorisediminis]